MTVTLLLANGTNENLIEYMYDREKVLIHVYCIYM